MLLFYNFFNSLRLIMLTKMVPSIAFANKLDKEFVNIHYL